jgi:hypothetical protein
MAEKQDVAQNHHHNPHHKPHRWWNWKWPWSRQPVVYDPYYQPYYTTPWTFKETMAFFISFFVIFGILYLIYCLTKKDSGDIIKKDEDEVINYPSFWLIFIFLLISVIGIVLYLESRKIKILNIPMGINFAQSDSIDKMTKLFLSGTSLIFIGILGALLSLIILSIQLKLNN